MHTGIILSLFISNKDRTRLVCTRVKFSNAVLIVFHVICGLLMCNYWEDGNGETHVRVHRLTLRVFIFDVIIPPYDVWNIGFCEGTSGFCKTNSFRYVAARPVYLRYRSVNFRIRLLSYSIFVSVDYYLRFRVSINPILRHFLVSCHHHFLLYKTEQSLFRCYKTICLMLYLLGLARRIKIRRIKRLLEKKSQSDNVQEFNY